MKQTISHFHVNNSNSESCENATSYLNKHLVPGAPVLDEPPLQIHDRACGTLPSSTEPAVICSARLIWLLGRDIHSRSQGKEWVLLPSLGMDRLGALVVHWAGLNHSHSSC